MKNNVQPGKGDVASSFAFLLNFFKSGLQEVNPWNNIRVMHTNIKGDIMAGITVAIIALPLALAFGVGSGLGAITGIWGAICGGIIGGLFGGSKTGVSGPTGPKMVQLAAIMVGFRLASGEPDLTAAFTIIFLSGVILVGISFLRVSRFIYFTPYSVVAGFMCGIGVIVILLEFDHFIGLPSAPSVQEAIIQLPYAVTHIKLSTLAVSLPTLGVLFLWPVLQKQWVPLKQVPGPLIGLLLGTGIAWGFGLNVEVIGNVPTGLPSVFLPDFTRAGEFLVPALSLAGLAIFDSLLTCVVADQITGERHSSDRETFGQGLANIAAGLVGGLTTATATMRTVANIKSGGKTPLAAVVHGLVLLALVLGLAPLAEVIPMAVLGAILIKVGIDILDYRILPILHRLPLSDMLVFWVVLFVTVWFDLLFAMGIGIALAFIRFVQEVSKVYDHQISEVSAEKLEAAAINVPGKNVQELSPQGPLFFGAVEPLNRSYMKAQHADTLIINLTNVTMVDLSGAFALEDIIKDAKSRSIKVYLTGANQSVRNILQRLKILEKLGPDYFEEWPSDIFNQAEGLGLSKKLEKAKLN